MALEAIVVGEAGRGLGGGGRSGRNGRRLSEGAGRGYSECEEARQGVQSMRRVEGDEEGRREEIAGEEQEKAARIVRKDEQKL